MLPPACPRCGARSKANCAKLRKTSLPSPWRLGLNAGVMTHWTLTRRTAGLAGNQRNVPRELPVLRRCFIVALLLSAIGAAAHTLPISYLHVAPDADYLHLELVFNPFELTFMSEVDDNKDAELSPAELEAHGQAVADRVVGALKLSTGGRRLLPETAGMDPALNGHHVRLRAHYKTDGRQVPLTVESDLINLTSGSHVTQVTYSNGTNTQMAQLDSHSHKVTFTPPGYKPAPSPRRTAIVGLWLLLVAVLALLVVGAGVLLYLRRQIQ